jgi:hypothetical protein
MKAKEVNFNISNKNNINRTSKTQESGDLNDLLALELPKIREFM